MTATAEQTRHFLKALDMLQGGAGRLQEESDQGIATTPQYLPPSKVPQFFSPQIRQLLRTLTPFEELECTGQAIRCLKGVDLQKGYSPEQALKDLDVLLALSEIMVLPSTANEVQHQRSPQ